MKYRPHRVDESLLTFARAMRHEAAPAEQKVWWCVRNRRLGGFKFRRQYPVGPFVADFCCPACRLIVELDGGSHFEREVEDERRTCWLERQGYTVARYSNEDVHEHLAAVLESILGECEHLSAEGGASGPSPPPSPLSTGERG